MLLCMVPLWALWGVDMAKNPWPSRPHVAGQLPGLFPCGGGERWHEQDSIIAWFYVLWGGQTVSGWKVCAKGLYVQFSFGNPCFFSACSRLRSLVWRGLRRV
jgi:hypothetical protein